MISWLNFKWSHDYVGVIFTPTLGIVPVCHATDSWEIPKNVYMNPNFSHRMH